MAMETMENEWETSYLVEACFHFQILILSFSWKIRDGLGRNKTPPHRNLYGLQILSRFLFSIGGKRLRIPYFFHIVPTSVFDISHDQKWVFHGFHTPYYYYGYHVLLP